MENLVRPNATGRRGFVQTFIMISYDLSIAEEQIGVMARLIPPGQTAHQGGFRRESALQWQRFASTQVRQNEMDFTNRA